MIELTNTKSNQPTEYEFQKIAIQRGLMNTKKELQQFQRVEAGVVGENRFNKWLGSFGKDHWISLRNTWFNDFSDFECDSILITHHSVYYFEIKNYFGKFVYENGECSSRGVPITYNPINQARNTTLHLRNITNEYSTEIPVRGVLVFIGEHNHVEIKDDIDYIDILRSNEVYQYIQGIMEEEARNPQIIQAQDLIHHYHKYEIEKPYPLTPYTREEMKKAKTGVFCARCSRPLKMHRENYTHCLCGFDELREAAIVRTACEYGVLTFGTNFTVRDIYNFLGGQISIKYLQKVLRKHFDIVFDAKILIFQNHGRPFSELPGVFRLNHLISFAIHSNKCCFWDRNNSMPNNA